MVREKKYTITAAVKQKGSSAAESKNNYNGVGAINDSKRPIPEETAEAPRRSCLQRHAFLLTMLLSTMIDGLGFQVTSQFKYRFFHDEYSDQLRHYNATRRSVCGEGKSLLPEVQVGVYLW